MCSRTEWLPLAYVNFSWERALKINPWGPQHKAAHLNCSSKKDEKATLTCHWIQTTLVQNLKRSIDTRNISVKNLIHYIHYYFLWIIRGTTVISNSIICEHCFCQLPVNCIGQGAMLSTLQPVFKGKTISNKRTWLLLLETAALQTPEAAKRSQNNFLQPFNN